jgi:eukaryotic-like serine/threonine-protein kinase
MVDEDQPTESGAGPTEPGESHTRRIVPGGSAGIVAMPAPGYDLGQPIGRGGMGEVLTAYDQRIGREVAIKRMRGRKPSEEAVMRFLREARIQARLDHPAIVPVHDIGADENDQLYFTMKRLTGRTLAHKLSDRTTPQKQLLRAFVDVCLAVDFAHGHGVVHRDLKPANIMLGDYGEVYIIDWGIARVLSESEPAACSLADIDSLGDDTQTGALLGTPGFIAPEQLRGDPVTPSVDAYALGAILFEILAGEPLHPKGHQKAIASTLTAAQELPSRRSPEASIAPELDALCFAALDEESAGRPTARELADRVQAYLDGDRDVERRRELAAENVEAARAALLDKSDPEGHSTALRRAGRALALDPESDDAAELVSKLLLDPPTTAMPPGLIASLDEQDRQLAADRSRKSIWAYMSLIAIFPLVLLLEVKNWLLVAGFYATVLIGIGTSWRISRTGRPTVAIIVAVTMSIVIMFTRVAGPFVLTPLAICCALVALTSITWVNQRTWVVVAWTTTAAMLPPLLEWLGVLPRTTAIAPTGELVIAGNVFRSHGTPDELALVIATYVFTLVVALLSLAIVRRRNAAQRQLHIQAWHLGHLVPGDHKRPWATRQR